jgi:hypothetical protein
MDRPIHLWAALALAITAPATGAEETSSDSTAKRPRLVSSHVANVLNDLAAREVPPTPVAGAATAESAARQRIEAASPDVPANRIVRLPDYIVREPRLPSREEVTPRRSLEQMAMQKYFGDETSLYRVLNMFSPVHLWRKIPGLGKFPFMIGQFNGPGSGPARGQYTTEDRAMSMDEADRMRERSENLMGLLSLEDRARALNPEATPPRPVPLK